MAQWILSVGKPERKSKEPDTHGHQLTVPQDEFEGFETGCHDSDEYFGLGGGEPSVAKRST
jgi:hypothetical protein